MLKIQKRLLVLLVISLFAWTKMSADNDVLAAESENHAAESAYDDHDGHDDDEEETHLDDDHDHEAENPVESDAYADHEGHAHNEEQVVVLDSESKALIGLQTVLVQHGSLETTLRLTGKVDLNADRVAHVVPYVPGIVSQVNKTLGDAVQAGEIMAVIHSRRLSEAKAAYLASVQRYELAKSIYEREKKLWGQQISSEQEFLQGKIDFAEAEIDRMLAEQKLRALGFGQTAIDNLPTEAKDRFMQYDIVAPFDGVIIDKHITLGEVIKEDAAVFTVADLKTVWVDLAVFAKDLLRVAKGRKCTMTSDHQTFAGEISFVSSVLDPTTRTATARVVVDNANGQLRPGLFVTAVIYGSADTEGWVIPAAAVQTVNGTPCIFVEEEHGYALRPVTVGRRNATHVEIYSGLQEGEHVVTQGAFDLKAKIVTSTLDSHAGHGH